MRETELKIMLDEALERRLRDGLARSGLAKGNPRTASLRSVYYDTHDHKLREAGIALRLRKDGRRWIQTVKAGKTIASGLSRTSESECPAPGGKLDLARIPDADIRDRVLKRLQGAELSPVCESQIKRNTFNLTLPGGGEIELAIDAGQIRAGARSADLREAELELKAGLPGALYATARLLLPDGGVQFSNLSKSERGFLLAAKGHIMPEVAPRFARPVILKRKQSEGSAAQSVLRECLDQVAANILAVRHAEDPEGPHQLRVGLRRLRAAMALFRCCVTGDEAVRLNAEARWLGRVVSVKRDLDVALIDVVRPEAAAHPSLAGFPALIAALEAAGEAERSRLTETLTSARAQGFLLDLAAFVETGNWLDRAQVQAPLSAVAHSALDRAWRRAREKAHRIDRLTAAERHALRKAVKRLRYMAEFLAPLYKAKRIRPFVKRLKDLQDLFGELNDAAMIESVFEAADAPAADDPAAQRAAGLVIGRRIERAERDWVEARARWKALAAAPRFWE